jgi:ribose-phosphate pyrophosphokinase
MVENALMLFTLAGSRDFAEKVARHLGVSLSAHEERDFEDGEHKSRPLVNVRGRDVFVVHSLYSEPGQSPNDKLCRLLFFIATLKDASAAHVTAIIPYLAYARKDRKSQTRDPVTTRYVASLFEAVGVDRVVTLDVHNLAAFQNAFRCRTDHLEANKLFVDYFAPLLREHELVVVSPDAGGIKRAEQFRQGLSRALAKPIAAAFAEKHRSLGVVSGELLVGEVKGRTAIIVDDLISSGTTIARTARACRQLGANTVYAAASHGLFAADANALLADPAVERIVVTDTVPPFRLSAGLQSKVTVLDSSLLFAEAIRRIHGGESIVDLLQT